MLVDKTVYDFFSRNLNERAVGNAFCSSHHMWPP